MNSTGGIGQSVTFPFSFLVKAKYTYRGRVLTDPLGVLAKHLKAEHGLAHPVGEIGLPSLLDATEISRAETSEEQTAYQPSLPLDAMLATPR